MHDPDVPPAVQLAAAKDVLDRNNLTGKTTIEVEMKPWEEVLSGIVADIPDGTPMREFERPGDGAVVVVNSERVDDYAIDDADWGGSEAQGDASPEPWPARTVDPHRAREAPARPVVRGDDAPPPPRYAPTASGPRSRRNPRHRR